jgi:ankyrin repeat protein
MAVAAAPILSPAELELLWRQALHGSWAPALLAVRGGLPVDTRFGDDHASLLWYAAGRHPPAVEALLALGASANAASRYLDTPLIQAARSGGPASVMRALIAAGADVNTANDEGWTPLSTLVASGSSSGSASKEEADCLRTLLDHPGLDSNMAPRGRGIMAVMGAVVMGRDEVAQVIREEVGRAG